MLNNSGGRERRHKSVFKKTKVKSEGTVGTRKGATKTTSPGKAWLPHRENDLS